MMYAADPFVLHRELPNGAKPRPDWFKYLALAAIFALSFVMFYVMCLRPNTDIHVHADTAASYDFRDLHTITSKMPNPLWHVIVAVLNKLGVPIYIAAALITALCKLAAMWLTHRLLTVCLGERVDRNLITAATLLLMIVTPIRVSGVNPYVYRGATSPNVWHNPTQNIVTAFMMLTIPYTVHLYQEFLAQREEKGKLAMLPWSQVFWLALMLGLGLAAKPTFMQAYMPACFVFFLVALLRWPRNWRFFGQIVLAFVPSVAYFLLQYLFYTGVVVERTSWVIFGSSLFWFRFITPQMLLQIGFPLFVLIFCYRKGMLKNPLLIIALLMLAFSYAEALYCHEVGARQDHGNFMWALMNSSFLLWVLMGGHFLDCVSQFVRSKAKKWYQWLVYAVGSGLLLWHAGSSVYYIVLLFTSNRGF